MSRPIPRHVLWITTDHMRFDCIGAHGNGAVHTPNLDALVSGGVTFENCFAQNPLCMPSRCSFMSGLYPQQTGVTANGHCLHPDFEPIAAREFKAAGYQTAQIGKLHFQPHEDNDLDPRQRNSYGFDVFWLAEEPGPYEDAYMTWLRTEYPELVDTFRVVRSNHPDRAGEREGKVLDAPWQASFSGWVAEQTCRYLDTGSRQEGQMVHMGFYAPHPPLNPTREMFAPYADAEIPLPARASDETADKPEPLASMLRMCSDWGEEKFRQYRRHFYAMVTGVDMAVGQVMERLRSRGQLDDTLIIFTSDHGDMCGDHGMILKQHSFYDEVMSVPWVMHWPAGFGDSPRRVEGLVEMVDMLPTLLGLCGARPPRVMQGRNYAEALLNGDEPDTRENVFAYHNPGHAMLRSQKHKYIRYANDEEVLYDLSSDPDEVVNRVGDPACSEALHELRSRMLGRSLEASRSPQRLIYRY
ncbi:MAG: sulfatase-like hydrolase/transferase [Planctomycetes bacterium]|nr:sulfatase-like hydrolase/transferase [Planctomycetota bacterium]